MNFMLFEDVEGKKSFAWENQLNKLPTNAIAFSYFQQDNISENGIRQSIEYRICIPVKFIIGDMYIGLDSNISSNQNDEIYCLYSNNGKKMFSPINQNTTLVRSFDDLEKIFSFLIKNEKNYKN